jgi:hypothetical protein
MTRSVMSIQYLAIYDKTVISRGSIEEIIHQVKVFDSNIEPMVFEEESCRRIDFSWYGDAKTVQQGEDDRYCSRMRLVGKVAS